MIIHYIFCPLIIVHLGRTNYCIIIIYTIIYDNI